uniref:Putative L-type lectin-domain containing receptor kinase S.5 n=1 Tax=Populus alba TaxID=43335 RepID=A0A4U5QNZ8_POPAL|nr:putative L-type lectin-domain containing receptor kinase S.5 [Populus alba]
MCKKNNRSLGLYSVATARGILLFLICIFLNEAALNQASLDPSVKETSFSYPSFDADSCNSTLICRGSVSVGDRSLKLTPEPLPVDSNSTQPVLKDQIGRVLFHHPVIAWLSYINTTFTVRIFAFPNTATNGDGMAFIMAQNNSPSPPDSEGSYLGVLDKSTEGNPLVSFLNQSIDMSKWVPNSVYVGFSAATGPFAEAHEAWHQALLYLHEQCGHPIVHRDVKPNNVMLDSDFNARLGDFGLARLLSSDSAVTTMLAGTPGYLAPEVAYTGKAAPESDVYSFGMVVIEVVTGQRSRGIFEENRLLDYVWSSHGRKTLLEGVDRKLEGKYDEQQVKRTLLVGLACLHPDAKTRPTIRKVEQIFLNPDEPLMEVPEWRPNAFFVPLSSSASTTRSATDFGSKSDDDVLLQSTPEEMVLDEIVVHHEDSDI